jgi:hypothetical protein
MSIESRLRELGIILPRPPQPAGNYSATVRVGNSLFYLDNFLSKMGAEIYRARWWERNRYAARVWLR